MICLLYGLAPPSGWQLLFKGVENMGGDLFQLWAGGQTINPLDPTAANLFPQKPYKPDLSNHWNSLCLDKVRYTIFYFFLEKDATPTLSILLHYIFDTNRVSPLD